MIIEYDPKKKYKKIAIIVLVVAAISWMVYQQITLNAIRKVVMPVGNIPASDSGLSSPNQVLSNDVVAQAKSDLVTNTNDLTGTVKGVSGNVLKVEAEIVDLNKIKDATVNDVKSFTKTKKTFSVATNDKTEFLSKKLADIKAGDSIQVFTDDAVYSTDSVTATRIVSPVVSDKDVASQGPKFISGKAAKVESNTLTVTAISKDGKETGTYAVKIAAGTKFIKQELSNPPKNTVIKVEDIRPGNNVIVVSANSIGDRKEFEATQVILMVVPPKK